MGRPRLIDQPCPGMDGMTYGETVLDFIRLGAPLHLAAKAAGVGDSTLRSWREQGSRKRPDARYRAFLADCEKAEAESVIRSLADIRRAAAGDPYKITKTITKTVRGANGELVPVTETTTTEGVKREWQAAAWLSERRATADFGRHRVWKDAPPPGDTPPGEDEATLEAAAAKLHESIEAYRLGRADVEREHSGVDGEHHPS